MIQRSDRFSQANLATPFKSFEPFCNYDRYQEILHGCDIALLPLEPTRFNEMKSDLKFLECAAHGVAVLASPTVYAQTIQEGETGLIYRDPVDFEEKLRGLLEDDKLRRGLTLKAYDWVKANRMLSQHYRERAQWYRAMHKALPQLQADLRERVPELFMGTLKGGKGQETGTCARALMGHCASRFVHGTTSDSHDRKGVGHEPARGLAHSLTVVARIDAGTHSAARGSRSRHPATLLRILFSQALMLARIVPNGIKAAVLGHMVEITTQPSSRDWRRLSIARIGAALTSITASFIVEGIGVLKRRVEAMRPRRNPCMGLGHELFLAFPGIQPGSC